MSSIDKLIIRDAQICGGQPVFRGTRVPLRTILANLAEGDSFDEILRSFPSLDREQLQATVAFAAESALEDVPLPAIPQVR